MKIQTLLPVAALFVASIFSSCKNDAPASKGDATQSAPTDAGTAQPGAGVPTFESPVAPAPGSTTATPPPASAEPPQNASGVWHYTCAKGCAGGGGSVAPCAKCGAPLAHNAAYHGTPNPAPTVNQTPSQTPGQAPVQMPPSNKPPEPPQNAAGVWHYTCPGGCAGGAGAAVACAKCSKKLEHNKAYHQ